MWRTTDNIRGGMARRKRESADDRGGRWDQVLNPLVGGPGRPCSPDHAVPRQVSGCTDVAGRRPRRVRERVRVPASATRNSSEHANPYAFRQHERLVDPPISWKHQLEVLLDLAGVAGGGLPGGLCCWVASEFCRCVAAELRAFGGRCGTCRARGCPAIPVANVSGCSVLLGLSS